MSESPSSSYFHSSYLLEDEVAYIFLTVLF